MVGRPDSVGSKCAENSAPGMRFTRSQRCILLSLTAPTPDIGFHTEGISSEVETSASTPTHSLVSPRATNSSSEGFPFLFHLQERKIRDTQSSNGEPFGKISIFGFMAWLSLGKKFPGITLVGGDQVPGRGQWSIHFMESANCTIRSSAPSLASQCCCYKL